MQQIHSERTTARPARLSRRAAIALVAAAAVALAVAAQGGDRAAASGDPLRDVGIDPQLGATLPINLSLRDSDGTSLRLADCFRGRPVVLQLVYYECPMLCNLATSNLIRTLRTMSLAPGREFDLVTVSFDPREPPARAAAAKRTALKRYGRQVPDDGWRFLTGDAAAIDALTNAVGYRTVFDTKTGSYSHAAALIVLTPAGSVSRYLYGVDYTARDLRLSIIEASRGEVGHLGDEILLLCYQYDPSRGRYGLAIMNLLRLTGGLTVAVLAGGIVWMIRRDRKRAGAARVGESSHDTQAG
ncbi:MAG: SCO family protein [Planctomycetes bacterium]|nr:SCO family protein [Planctomycetota bacterium]